MGRNKDDEMPESAPNLNPWDVLDRLTAALERVSAKQVTEPSSDLQAIQERLSMALERLASTQLEGSKLIADETRRAHRPSNNVVPGVSAFNRRGDLLPDYKKPPLKCVMMIPWIAEWESLTREEVELLNLLESGEYMVVRIDKSKVRCVVTLEYKVDGKTPSRLLMTHDTAFNNDNFRLMPPLTDMLRHILKQHDRPIAAAAAAVLSDEEEEALIEAGDLTVSV